MTTRRVRAAGAAIGRLKAKTPLWLPSTPDEFLAHGTRVPGVVVSVRQHAKGGVSMMVRFAPKPPLREKPVVFGVRTETCRWLPKP